jgi:hypothetical protein
MHTPEVFFIPTGKEIKTALAFLEHQKILQGRMLTAGKTSFDAVSCRPWGNPDIGQLKI